jgi:hypothetical protein
MKDKIRFIVFLALIAFIVVCVVLSQTTNIGYLALAVLALLVGGPLVFVSGIGNRKDGKK